MIRRALLGLALGACLDPTEITIVVTTNYACSDFGQARIRVGSSMTETSVCAPDGTIGTLVVVPGGSDGAEIDIRVTGAVREAGNAPPPLDLCEAQDTNGGGCVSTSRSLHLILHRSLTLPVMIDSRCAHVSCGAGSTCIAGACTPIGCEVGTSNVVTCQPDDAGAPPDAATKITVVDLRAHTDGTCVVLSTGDVLCWGGNAGSRFGDQGGATAIPPSPVPNAKGAKRIAIGDTFACSLMQDDHIECWGANQRGQLGDGTTTARSTPKPIIAANAVPFDDLVAGALHACAHTAFPDAKLYCWGSNVNGQVALPASAVNVTTPTLVAGNYTFAAMCAGDSHTCALGNTTGQPTTDNTYCWGSSGGANGTSTGAIHTPTVVPSMPLPDMVSCGADFTLVAMGNGPVGTGSWGENAFGQCDPTKLTSPLPPSIGVPAYLLPLAAGRRFACGLVQSPANTMMCWGDASLGELGPNATSPGPSTFTLDAPVKLIAAGDTHACAVTQTSTTDEVWCWGDGSSAPARILP